jgi:hypothetical protein
LHNLFEANTQLQVPHVQSSVRSVFYFLFSVDSVLESVIAVGVYQASTKVTHDARGDLED